MSGFKTQEVKERSGK